MHRERDHIDNTALLDDVTVIDVDTHSTDQAPDIMPYLADEELRELEMDGYATKGRRKGPFGGDGWNTSIAETPGHFTRDVDREPILLDRVENWQDLMDRQETVGADTFIVGPTLAMKTNSISDYRRRKAYLDATNRYLMDNFRTEDAPVFIEMLVAADEPEESAEQIRRYGDDDRVKAILTSSHTDYPFGHDRYAPILEAAEDAGLPIAFHGFPARMNQFPNGSMGMGSLFEHVTLSFPLSYMRHAVSLVGQEVPERYDVDFCFWESGFAWLVGLIGRMDRWFERRHMDAPGLSQPPSEYLRNFYFNTNTLDKPREPEHLQDIIDMCGIADRVCFASDYPHKHGDPLKGVVDHDGLREEQKVKILQDNAQDLFDL